MKQTTFTLALIAGVAQASGCSNKGSCGANTIDQLIKEFDFAQTSKGKTLGQTSTLAKGRSLNNLTAQISTQAGSHTLEAGEIDVSYSPQQLVTDHASFSANSDICTISQNRNKADLDDFYGTFAGNETYTDEEFKPDDDSLFLSGYESETQVALYSPVIEWGRISERFDDHSLFGTNGVTPEDIRQGSLGNCWIMAGASAVAELPGRLEKVFLNKENKVSKNGIYGVNIYTLGVPHTIIIDDYLPLRSNGSQLETFFAHIGDDNSFWGPVLEKAFAKLHGNYSHLDSGNPVKSVRTLTGAPYQMLWHTEGSKYGFRNWAVEELWDELVKHDSTDEIIQAGTPNQGTDQQQNDSGLAYSHAYSVLGVKTLSDGQRLVKMRNPWGKETYHGTWSDYSDDWTTIVLDEANHAIADDGIFYMSIEDYQNQVQTTFVNMDTTGWSMASFLMLGDQTAKDGNFRECGSSCRRHRLTLESEVAQQVWITAHTWDERAITEQCWQESSAHHTIKLVNGSRQQSFYNSYGDLQLDPIQMEAGQKLEIVAEWNSFATDWSVVAWGEQGSLNVTHNDGIESDSLPYIAREQGPIDYTIPEPEDEQDQDNSSNIDPEVIQNLRDELKTCTDNFIEWAEDFDPVVPESKSCGAFIYEESVDHSTGTHYQVVMVNTCRDYLKRYTVYMDVQDWRDMVHFYSTYDINGVLVHDSIIRECHRYEYDDQIVGCTFELGYVVDHNELGLLEPWQSRAGWINGADSSGALWYSQEWIKIDPPQDEEETVVDTTTE